MTIHKHRLILLFLGLALVLLLAIYLILPRLAEIPPAIPGTPYVEVQADLKPLGRKMGTPLPGEWRYEHKEPTQSFEDYARMPPTRRTAEHKTIYLCLVGDFTEEQRKILEITQEYMAIYFDSPVRVIHRVPLKDFPEKARRMHPISGQLQLLTNYFLEEFLQPRRPDDALAYIAFTATDLWTKENGRDWNFLFGQAELRERVGVWSLARFGDPAKSAEEFQRCLKLTLGIATHETGHILSMYHCQYYWCNMNGSNHLDEAIQSPLMLCPICLRKLCWNLQIDPKEYLMRLLKFAEKHGMKDDAEHYRKAIELLK